jgi:hypothetical protein
MAHVNVAYLEGYTGCSQGAWRKRNFSGNDGSYRVVGWTKGLWVSEDDIKIMCLFYVHVTVHRNKFLFNKTNRRTNFPNLFLLRNSTCFGEFLCPSSGVFHCTFGTGICHQTCMTYTSAECTVENYWLWAEKLPETRRVSWQKTVYHISNAEFLQCDKDECTYTNCWHRQLEIFIFTQLAFISWNLSV